MSETDNDDDTVLQRQMAEIQIKLEANRRAKAEDKKANRLETMMESVLERLDEMNGRLERVEQASMEKMAVYDQIAGCVEQSNRPRWGCRVEWRV
jgi:hypothetical protein